MIEVPAAALPSGFDNGPGGPHTSRTIMLAELGALFGSCPPAVGYPDYAEAVVGRNVLLKRTETTRRESLRRLRELYGLSRDLVVFRALRDLWDEAPAEQPLLALLAALARDPLLRAAAGPVLNASPGDSVSARLLSASVQEQLPDRLNTMTLANIGRHAASSWTQSGHLRGRSNKTRARAASGPAATAYALLLGYLCGSRGEALFETFWARATDASQSRLHDDAFAGSRAGYLEYRHAGGVTQVRFSHLLREEGVPGG
jgi:hypothetical protein